MTKVRKIFRKLNRIYRRFRHSEKEINKLKNHSDQRVRLLVQSLEESLQDNYSNEERFVVQAIERKRKEIIKKNTQIEATNRPDSIKTDSTKYLAKVSSKRKSWAGLQLKIIRNLKPENGLEFGTCLGITAAYQALGMKLNGSGTFTTMEGLQSRYNFALELFDSLNIENINSVQGNFNELLPEVIKAFAPIDYVFIDGDHRYESTVNYFKLLLPHLTKDAIVVLDDIRLTDEMFKAWNEIKSDISVSYSFDFIQVGLCFIGKTEKKESFQIALW